MKAKSRGPRLAIGDAFIVPLDSDPVSYGQVIGTFLDDGYYFALFATAYSRAALPDLPAVTRDRIALVALSFDARIANGDWQVVGSAPLPQDPPLPAYREARGSLDRVDVVDHSGKRRRPATPSEAAALQNRKLVAPIRLEKAIRALHGLEPWLDAYDDLRPSGSTTSLLFGSRN